MSGDYLCRVCEATEDLEILFKKENESLIDMLTTILDAPVEPDDFLPQCICANCIQKLQQAYKFKVKFLSTEQKLRSALTADIEYVSSEDHSESNGLVPQDNCIEEIPIKDEINEPEDSNLVSEIIVKEELEPEDTKPIIDDESIAEDVDITPRRTTRKRKASKDMNSSEDAGSKEVTKRGGRGKRATPARGKRATPGKKKSEE